MDDDTIAFPDNRHRVKVGEMREWHYLKIHCDACKHQGRLYTKALQARFDAETAFSDLAPRFRCTGCGKLGSVYWDVWQIGRNA